MKTDQLAKSIGQWSKIIGLPIAIIGIIITFYQLVMTLKQIEIAQRSQQIQSVEITKELFDYVSETRIKAIEDLDKLANDSMSTPQKLLEKFKTGENIYLSKEFTNIRKFRGHLDKLAVYVKNDILDFKIVFQIITFPDNFWVKSEKYRELIGNNYWGPGKPLKDFDFYINELYEKYRKERNKL